MGNSRSKLDLNVDSHWLREDDNKGWKKYDSETSQVIERTLNDAMDKKTKGLIYITLNEGPFFGQRKNIGKYECNFIVDFSNPNKPIIHNAVQKNVITGYKRNIKRQIKSRRSEPDEKSSDCNAKWEYMDDYDDAKWTEYDKQTAMQIEVAYNKKKHKIYLDKGPFFSKNRRKYYIEFDYLSGVTIKQVNHITKYARLVRRKPQPKWEWKSEHEWRLYDNETCAQIEHAFINKKKQIELNKGKYFSQHKGIYFIIFDYSKSPVLMTQLNNKTQGPRSVRRVSNMNDNNNVSVVTPVKGYDDLSAAVKRIINGMYKQGISEDIVEQFMVEIKNKRFNYMNIVHDILNAKTMSVLQNNNVYNILLDLTTFTIPEEVKDPYGYYDTDSSDDCEQEACILDDMDEMNDVIGLAMGGSKDVNNFRKSIEQNVMPTMDCITYNGLFYEYYFDTKGRKNKDNIENKNNEESMLFYPTYCY
eukprot:533471_1